MTTIADVLRLLARPAALIAAAAVTAGLPVAPPAGAAPACVDKSGSATGITRDFAEYESLLIIRQVTGNWPIESDRIVGVKSACKPEGGMWTCVTRAKVCRG
jgi:hypothetical protein